MASPEELAERYSGRWTIYRESDLDGTGGQWVADSCLPGAPGKITAAEIEALAEQLAAAEE